MKILIVSSFLPYPLFSGGHVRLYNLLKELSPRHEITLVCEKRKHQAQDDINEVKKFCKDIFVVDRKKQWSPEVVFHTAISSLPFLLAGHNLPQMKKILAKLVREKTFDVIHVETFYVAQNLPKTTIPVVLVEHNIEYAVYQRFVDNAPFLLKPFLQIDVEKIKYWEKKAWIDATKVVGVSDIEAKQMRQDAAVVPNGVNLSDFPYKTKLPKTNEKTVLFMGDFKWIQNRDTAFWILKDIWPLVQSSVINNKSSMKLKLWVVGKHIPENIKQYASSTIVFDEHAPSKTSDIYKDADILLSPIKVGGGTSYKILEAMASGVPVVTTSLGIEGLSARHKKHALTGQSQEELSSAVLALLNNVKVYNSIRKQARKLVEDNYSWKQIAQKLEGVYTDAVKK